MELGKRKEMILAAIVEQYIKTGEPIGSKFLMTALPISVSSATIRNEMNALAEMGYLDQPTPPPDASRRKKATATISTI